MAFQDFKCHGSLSLRMVKFKIFSMAQKSLYRVAPDQTPVTCLMPLHIPFPLPHMILLPLLGELLKAQLECLLSS